MWMSRVRTVVKQRSSMTLLEIDGENRSGLETAGRIEPQKFDSEPSDPLRKNGDACATNETSHRRDGNCRAQAALTLHEQRK